jgi:Glycosyltransferase
MKKVLMVAGRMNRGGLEAMLMGFFRNVDREKVTFDFMVNYEEEGFYDREIKALGGKIYIMPRLNPKNIFRYVSGLNRFFKEHKGEYDVVHGHLTSVGILYLTIAKWHGVKTTAIHAHYTDTVGNHYALLERLMLLPLRFCTDYFFACSDKAAKFCYGKNIVTKPNYKLIKNGVDIDKYKFNSDLRMKKRQELGIAEKYTILNVGRFETQKNHVFLMQIMKELHEKEKDAVLILVGSGSLEEKIKALAKDYGLDEYVLFTGDRSDVNELLLAADVFVLPSLFEGLPVVGIEAQTSGIPCLFSDTVTTEIDITGNCKFLPIDDSDKWVKTILKDKNIQRTDTSQLVQSAGYDIKEQAKWLEDFYLKA